MHPGKVAVAIAASLVLVPITIWAGLIAVLAIAQQLLAGFVDLSQASWTSWLNPAVILGIRSPGGTGGIWDALVGGPGAPGGTVSRYVTFMIFGLAAYAAATSTLALWRIAART